MVLNFAFVFVYVAQIYIFFYKINDHKDALFSFAHDVISLCRGEGGLGAHW